MGSRNEIRAEKEWEDMNYTYILKCSDETLYTGWTNDLEKRNLQFGTGHFTVWNRSFYNLYNLGRSILQKCYVPNSRPKFIIPPNIPLDLLVVRLFSFRSIRCFLLRCSIWLVRLRIR